MSRSTCLADIEAAKIDLIRLAVKRAKAPALVVEARLDVTALHALAPDVLICDLDALAVDALETLRQVRFVLPDCTIVVYTLDKKRSWGRQCHTAGANGVLSKASSEAELATGLRLAMRDGCVTDPRTRAA